MPGTNSHSDAEPPSRTRTVGWISWLIGAALLAAVIAVALHLSEGREIARLAEEARPSWLLLALLLQIATYYAQAEVFRETQLSSGASLPRTWLWQLSVAKLFMDQALPSGGISGTALVARALQQRHITRTVAAAASMINLVSYYVAYIVCLIAAMLITGIVGRTGILVLLAAMLLVLFGVGLTVGVLALSGRKLRPPQQFEKVRFLRNILEFIEDADPGLTRDSWLLLKASGWQAAIFLLDTLTVWVLIHSLGARPSIEGVFASFMISSLFRSIGIAPGGLGTYEATSVLTLRMVGVSVPAAVAATLLFRGLSFWLPMLPGYWFFRKVIENHEQ